MREAKLLSDRWAVLYLLWLVCLLVPGAVYAGDDGAEGSTGDVEASDGDTEEDEDSDRESSDDEDFDLEAQAEFGEADTLEAEPADSVVVPEEHWDLSRQELAELEALEALEASDGLASSHRIQVLRRKRARRAKRAVQSVAGGAPQRQWSLGVQGTGLASLRKGSPTVGVGGFGGFVEVSVVQGELGLELASRVLFEEGELHIPVQLLFKKPWDRGDFRFFMGVGPAAVFGVRSADTPAAGGDAQEDEQGPPAVHFGFSGVAGLTWWMRPRLGLSAELNYNIVIDDGASHELGASVGVVFAL